MRIAYISPAACSSCFGQYPEQVHVDFESAWDGPVIDAENGRKYSIDELVICEQCLRAAYAKLPKTDDEDAVANELAELKEGYQKILDYSLKLQAGVANLERAINCRPEAMVEATEKQPKPRPRPVKTG